MSETKPHKARAGKKRRRIRKIGSIADAQRKLWQAITCAEDVLLDDESDSVTTLKAVHAITSASTAYAKLIEVGELEARLTELEEALKHQPEHGMRRVA
ncbi:MAG: hypothetical protein RhofKO_10620 [Rhodothermales bacterium]